MEANSPPLGVLSSTVVEEDQALDHTLRPLALSEYIGQTKIKENLAVFIAARRKRREALDHVLLYGPPGLGKTTLATIIGREMGATVRSTSGPAVERPGDLAAILSNLEEGDLLFIDEIHRLHPTVEEVLYPAMEDFKLDLVIGQGPAARSIKLGLPRFTLVGATTRMGRLTAPLRGRFGITHHLGFYPAEELREIVQRSAGILGVRMEPAGAEEIARRSRGTPRIANRLLKRARDFAEVKGDGVITTAIARLALDRLEIDPLGLDEMDKRLLEFLIDTHGGRPVGLNTLASALGEEKETLEEIHEPYLIQIGLLVRTPRGRQATERAFRHFRRPAPAGQDGRFPDRGP